MSLIAWLVIMGVIGVVLYFVQKAEKLNATIKWIIYCVLIGTAIYITLDATGVLDEVRNVKVPHV